MRHRLVSPPITGRRVAGTELSLEQLVTSVATDLMGVTAPTLHSASEKLLHQLVDYFAVDLSFLRRHDHRRGTTTLVAEWPPRSDIPDPDPLGVIRFDDADPIFAATEHLSTVMLTRPDGADADYQDRVRQGSGIEGGGLLCHCSAAGREPHGRCAGFHQVRRPAAARRGDQRVGGGGRAVQSNPRPGGRRGESAQPGISRRTHRAGESPRFGRSFDASDGGRVPRAGRSHLHGRGPIEGGQQFLRPHGRRRISANAGRTPEGSRRRRPPAGSTGWGRIRPGDVRLGR